MAVKWIWGFEAGAGREFYSGSGWVVDSPRTDSSASSAYPGQGFMEGTDSLYDFCFNKPHQPSTVCGGGQYSLKIAAPWHTAGGGHGIPGSLDMSEDPIGIMSPSFGNLSQGCLSFSIHSDTDFANWPYDPAVDFGMFQRFLAIYPHSTTMVNTSGSDLGTIFKPGFLDSSISLTPDLPAQLQLYSIGTGSGPTADVKIAAVCRYGFANTGSVPTAVGFGPALGIADSCNVFWPNMPNIFSVLGGAPWGGGTNWGLVVYTSSAGVSLQEGWNEVSVGYIPHATNGAVKVYLNGSIIIDQEGVPTGYSSSVDDSGTPEQTDLGWGKILFTTTPYMMQPRGLGTPNLTGTIEPTSFLYDHVVVFDSVSDISAATSSIYVQGVLPGQDRYTGSFSGDDSGTSDLYAYVDDPNYFMINNYLTASLSTSPSSCDFYMQHLNTVAAGKQTWDMSTISQIVGVNIINAVSASSASGSSVLRGCDPSCSTFETGSSFNISGKVLVCQTTGSDPDGRSWNYLTGTGGESLASGFKFNT